MWLNHVAFGFRILYGHNVCAVCFSAISRFALRRIPPHGAIQNGNDDGHCAVRKKTTTTTSTTVRENHWIEQRRFVLETLGRLCVWHIVGWRRRVGVSKRHAESFRTRRRFAWLLKRVSCVLEQKKVFRFFVLVAVPFLFTRTAQTGIQCVVLVVVVRNAVDEVEYYGWLFRVRCANGFARVFATPVHVARNRCA